MLTSQSQNHFKHQYRSAESREAGVTESDVEEKAPPFQVKRGPGASPVVNALSFDVEDYFMVSGFERVVDRASWDEYPQRLEVGLNKILAILDRHNVKATFFFLGWVAERYLDAVKLIAAQKHEIALHGYEHRLLYGLTPREFEADLQRCIDAVRQSYAGPLLGSRAPSFSVRDETLWALPIMKKLGLQYDSSVFPIERKRYGMQNSPTKPYEIQTGLIEFPMSTIVIFGKRIPVAGGGYLRLYPYWLTSAAIKLINRRGDPAVVYMHPWEFDPEQPRIKADWANSFRHRVNLHKTEERLDLLCRTFKFGTMREVLGL